MRNEGAYISEEDKKRIVGEVSFVKCLICKQNYTPDILDISLNANFYYKNCKYCRMRRQVMKKKSLDKAIKNIK